MSILMSQRFRRGTLACVSAGLAFWPAFMRAELGTNVAPTALRDLQPPPGVGTFPALSAFPGEGPVRTADWFRSLWIQRRMQWWRDGAKDQGAVVFLGDSITQGWGTLAKDFPGLQVANRGISGDTTRGVLYRLKGDVLDIHPRAVVLLIGTNDLEERATPERIAANLRAILAALAASDPKLPVVVCEVMPSSASKARPAEQIRQLNALLAGVVKAFPQAVICATWSVFADESGNARPSEFPDLLHPNGAGYAKWARALRPLLKQLKLLPAN